MSHLLWVPEKLFGLNDIIRYKGGRRHGVKYTSWKADFGNRIGNLATAQGFRVQGAFWSYLFVEPRRDRDPSNIIAGAIKVIEDGLKEAGFIENDGWKQVQGIAPFWICDKDCPGTLVATHASHRFSEFSMTESFRLIKEQGHVWRSAQEAVV